MARDRRNCWEHKLCGREPGGALVDDLGVCPAATEVHLDGAHGGENGGRACWVVAGTYCNGEVQGTFSDKVRGCASCAFFNEVQGREGDAFEYPPALLARLGP